MKKQFLLFLFAAAAIFPTNLVAQNKVYFPYVVNDSQTSTELVFTNSTSKDATVALVSYQEDGTSVNQSPLIIPANGQVVVSAASLGVVRGWVLADTNVDGVKGDLRVGSPDGSALDITDPAQVATTIILPFVASGSGTSTQVSLVNTSVNSCRLKISLFKQDGSALPAVFKVLPPHGILIGSLSTIFPGDSNFDNASYIMAQATPINIFSAVVKIAGFEVVSGFQSPTQGIYARTDIAALTGIPLPSAGQVLVFPHVPTGMNWFSLIGLVNPTGSDVTVSLSFVDDAGALISTPNNPASVKVPTNGSIRKTSKELFAVPDDNLRSGSVQVTSSSLVGFLCVGTIAGSSIAASPAQGMPYSNFLFPAVDETGNSFTGTALLNLNDSTAIGSLSLVSPQGLTSDTKPFTLGPQQRMVNRIGDKSFFLQAAGQSGGYISVSSSSPLFGQAFLGVPDKTLSTLSPQPTPSGSVAPPQSLFAVGGQISFALTPDNSANAPVPGISVALSKGVTQLTTVTTDSIGGYVFQNLTSGVYTITPSSTGKTFSPQSRQVTLSSGNIDDEDFSISDLQVPVVTSVVPKETTARYEINSPGLRITVYGFGFKPSSQVLFNGKTSFAGVQIHTTYVSSTQLFADIPAQALRIGGYYLIQAQNGETEDPGEAVNFLVHNLQPEITYLDPPGLGPDNLPLPELTPLHIFGPGPGPVNMEIKINGKDFFEDPPGSKQSGSLVGFANTVPDIFPAIVPNIGSTPQCILVNGRSPFPIGVRAYDLEGNPIGGVSVTFTVPSVVTTAPTGSFPGGTGTVTVVTNSDGFAIAPVFTANPFAGSYVVSAEATIGGFLLTAVFNLSNYLPGEPCSNFGGRVDYVSSEQIIIHVAIPNKGTYAVQVANPSPSGGYSNLKSFVVTDGLIGNEPSIIALNPKNVSAGSPQITLTIGGIKFKSSAWVNFGTVRLIPTSVSSDGTILTVIVPSSLLTTAGIVPVTITNPGSPGDTGGTSRRADFIIKNIPLLGSLVPSSAKAGSSSFSLKVTGTNFQSNAYVNFGGTILPTLFVDANTLNVIVPASLVATPSTLSVTVTNPGGPGDTGGTSSQISFQVNP